MKSEYEVRFLDIDKDNLIEKLESLNAKFIGNWLQKRYIYDFNPVLSNKWIRLRTNGEVSTLTIKEITNTKIDGTKELEIVVSDFEKTNKILEELGYHARSIQMNKRIRYMLDDVEIDIDTWPRINTFVEFEGKNEDSIKDVVKKLNMNFEERTTQDVQSIYLSHGFTKEEMNNLNFEEEK
ncbi:MAG: CYTH domain-containing protein [Bacilli bacterium]|nr:CYTH domain-containing protein [Bacilli bacterium]